MTTETTDDATDKLADLAEDGIKLANSPERLRARLAELEGNQAGAATDRLREMATEDPARLNELYDTRDPELMQLLEQAHSHKEDQ